MTRIGAALAGCFLSSMSGPASAADVPPTLDEIAAFLNAQAEQKIILVGHTDYVGGHDYNIDLSKRRAAAVVDVLVPATAPLRTAEERRRRLPRPCSDESQRCRRAAPISHTASGSP